MCGASAKGTAVPTVSIDNGRVRVTEWRFRNKGDNTGWHTHEYDYVVVPMFTGILEIDLPDGSRTRAELTQGVPYYRDLGVEHDVINGNDFECAFIEVELLENKAASQQGPLSPLAISEPQRFRANLVIDTGELPPFCETDWIGNTLKVGNQVELRIVLSTPRCAVPTLEQAALASDTTFLAYLKKANAQPFLDDKRLPSPGVYAEVVSPGEIGEGDLVSMGQLRCMAGRNCAAIMQKLW